jgi:hypothetical protein
VTVDVEELLHRVALEDRDAELPPGSVQARVRRRRRRRIVARGVAAGVLVAGLGVAAAQLAVRSSGDVVVSEDAATETSVDVVATGLDGRTVMISLPAELGRDYEVTELAAELTAGNQRWRVSAMRTADATVLPPRTCGDPQQTAIGTNLEGWTIEISGDGFTPRVCPALLVELRAFELRDGVPSYTGDGSLGPIDGPDVAAVTDTAHLSFFHRPCGVAHDGERTPAGSVVSRVDDPARQATLSILCNPAEGVELWIESPTWPSRALLDTITIDAG